MKEHCPNWVMAWKKRRPRSNKPPESAICRHIMSCDLFKQGDHFSILHNEQFHNKLKNSRDYWDKGKKSWFMQTKRSAIWLKNSMELISFLYFFSFISLSFLIYLFLFTKWLCMFENYVCFYLQNECYVWMFEVCELCESCIIGLLYSM